MLSHSNTFREQNRESSSFFERLNLIITEAKKLGWTKEADEYWKHHLLEEHLENSSSCSATIHEITDKDEGEALQVASASDPEQDLEGPEQDRPVEVKKLPIPILPHDILLMIMAYLKDGDDFMHWVEALKDYPTAGDLPKILDFKRQIEFKTNHWIWPNLLLSQILKSERTIGNARLLTGISHFFESIDFGNSWNVNLVREAVISLKPAVYLDLSLDNSIEPGLICSLVHCKVSELSLTGYYPSALDTLFPYLHEIVGLKTLVLQDVQIPLADRDKHTAIICDSLTKSNIKVLVIYDSEISIAILADALPSTNLQQIDFRGISFSLPDMKALTKNLKLSNLSTLGLYGGTFKNAPFNLLDDYIRCLADGLVDSSVSELSLVGSFNRISMQSLMVRLHEMLSLRVLAIMIEDEEGPFFTFNDAPFFLQSVIQSSATVSMSFQNDAGEYCGRFTMTDLVQKYKRFKETYTKEERLFFSHIFKHDDDSIFP